MAKVIMIQGTMSNVGKSLITAGLCRIFSRDGYRTVPFKSQNMALNSYVTEDGLEMGRAQAVQAECCNVRPDARMNPILLKPTTDMGSQVIVNGRPVGSMRAKDYFKYKKNLIPDILNAYDYLDKNNDIIVIEGAGSPAEINLKTDDIVNMGLAKMVNAPVLLAGDINPGGIFAQLYGTVELLEKEERSMIKALLINKFRGDRSILEPGIEMLEEKCGIPVAGVIPYVNIDIEEEDSQSRRFMSCSGESVINIVVVRLPRISNYTDFMPLESRKYVSLRYAEKPDGLENADMIIIPGTKSTMADMEWLERSGFASKIRRLHHNGKVVCGICGGFQMMGEMITDSCGAESTGRIEGLGIFSSETEFIVDKKTAQSSGDLIRYGMFENIQETNVAGYEIHMGQTRLLKDARPFIETSFGTDGCVTDNAFGTYFHGIFENEAFTSYLLKLLCERKNVSFPDDNTFDYKKYKDMQYDMLAETLRENLDMDMIYDILWKGL